MANEIFKDSAYQPQGVKSYFRQFARRGALSLGAALQKPQKKFVRCLFSHYVFDDQVEQFVQHIKMLRNLGEFVDTKTLLELNNSPKDIDGRYFHLSYDDGLACLYRNAKPVLDKFQIPALVFVNPAVTGMCSVETKSDWDRATNYKQSLETMDWDTLKASGFEIGGHTMNHLRLSAISDDPTLLRFEIETCKQEIEEKLGVECRFFAWPYGRAMDVDATSIKALSDAGYDAVFAGIRGSLDGTHKNVFPRHHFEPQWNKNHVKFFASGGREAHAGTLTLGKLDAHY
jgi:peptidoglycan/xylan/chitin deacetylase (PgdA/CDA1 family)